MSLLLFESNPFEINTSDIEYSNYSKIWIRIEPHEIALKTLPLIPIIVIAIFGNLSIITVCIRIKGMRTCTNLFICNMAIADLMTILFCSWTIIVADAYQNFILGRLYCRLDGFLHVTCLLASVFSLVVISGDRLLGIVFPFSRRLSRGRAYVIMVAIWVSAMISASPPAIWRWLQTREWKDYEEVWCSENRSMLKFYWLILIILLVYMPLVVMAVAYTAIILQLDKYEHQLFLREHPVKMKYRKKVIKVLFMYVINYILFWVLFQVLVLFRYFKSPTAELPAWYPKVFFAGHILTYAQSAINPIIYGASNENFRKAFRITFRCLYKNNQVRPVANIILRLPLRQHRMKPNFQQDDVRKKSACSKEKKDPQVQQNTRETELKLTASRLNDRINVISPQPCTPSSHRSIRSKSEYQWSVGSGK